MSEFDEREAKKSLADKGTLEVLSETFESCKLQMKSTYSLGYVAAAELQVKLKLIVVPFVK